MSPLYRQRQCGFMNTSERIVALVMLTIAAIVGIQRHSLVDAVGAFFLIPLLLLIPVLIFSALARAFGLERDVRGLRAATPELRIKAAQSLRAKGSDAAAAGRALETALGDPDAGVRYAAALALVKVRPKNDKPLAELVAALAYPERRTEAAEALGELGAAGAAALRPLADALKDRGWDQRQRAMMAIYLIGPLPVLPEVIAAFDDPDSTVVSLAMSALRRVGPAAREALPQLARLAQDSAADWYPRHEAISLMAQVGGADAVPVLLALTDDPQFSLREDAVKALGGITPPTPEVLAVLEAKCHDPHAWVSKTAADALARLKGSGDVVHGNQAQASGTDIPSPAKPGCD